MIEVQRPTPGLRFVNRLGKRILQQEWEIFNPEGTTAPRYEWRDIPYQPNAEQGDLTIHP